MGPKRLVSLLITFMTIENNNLDIDMGQHLQYLQLFCFTFTLLQPLFVLLLLYFNLFLWWFLCPIFGLCSMSFFPIHVCLLSKVLVFPIPFGPPTMVHGSHGSQCWGPDVFTYPLFVEISLSSFFCLRSLSLSYFLPPFTFFVIFLPPFTFLPI